MTGDGALISLTEGTVESVTRFGKRYEVRVSGGGGRFAVYHSLDMVSVVAGHPVAIGDQIGYQVSEDFTAKTGQKWFVIGKGNNTKKLNDPRLIGASGVIVARAGILKQPDQLADSFFHRPDTGDLLFTEDTLPAEWFFVFYQAGEPVSKTQMLPAIIYDGNNSLEYQDDRLIGAYDVEWERAGIGKRPGQLVDSWHHDAVLGKIISTEVQAITEWFKVRFKQG